MKTAALAVVLSVLPAAAPPQTTDWSRARPVEVRLSNFAFAPASVTLPANQPISLTLVNDAGGGHNFSAPAFFSAAAIEPGEQGLVVNGTVEVPGHARKVIRLVPATGRYPLRCTHTLHTTFGMKGRIIVE
jgi:plastocyanin